MSMDFTPLENVPRILIEAALTPVAGTRIQPTNFPDLGAATYDAPDGTPTLLLESAQSMANRLEAVCWSEANDDLVDALMTDGTDGKRLPGIPYVRVKLSGLGDGTDSTSSLLEFHRLNSPYIMAGSTDKTITVKSKRPGASEPEKKEFPQGTPFADVLRPELGLISVAPSARGGTKRQTKATPPAAGDAPVGEVKERDDVAGVINLHKLAAVCFKYDPNSLIHGVFLEKIAGRLRHPRALSAFIEASGVARADSGGVKFDRVLPKPSVAGVDAKTGYGNVPFHRTEFTAKSITAFFSIDLAQLRGYGLGDDATQLLVALSLWKVRQFLDSNMRLRSACELKLCGGERPIRCTPAGFALPSAVELTATVATLMGKCKPYFADPLVTELTWKKP